MLGKNQAKTFAFRKRKSKRAKNQNKPNEFPLNISTTTASLEIAPVTIRVPTPNKFGSYVSGIQLADNVDPKLVEVVVQCMSVYLNFISSLLCTQLAYWSLNGI